MDTKPTSKGSHVIDLSSIDQAERVFRERERERYTAISQAIQAEDMNRLIALIAPGDRPDDEICDDQSIVLKEIYGAKKFLFLSRFLAHEDVIRDAKIPVLQEAVEDGSWAVLEMLLQGDNDNDLRGQAVIHAAEQGKLRCLKWLLQGHTISEWAREQAIEEAIDEDHEGCARALGWDDD